MKCKLMKEFQINWTNNSMKYATSQTNENVKDLNYKSYQAECFNTLHDEQFRIVNTPTGSGKSVKIKAFVLNDMMQGKKCIIAIPQLIIGSSFKDEKIKLPSGDIHDFEIMNHFNLTNKTSYSDLTKRFNTFIKKTTPSVLLCSHSTFIKMMNSAIRDNIDLNDISIFIDEAHHIKESELAIGNTNDTTYDANRMGKVLSEIQEEAPNASITLITATLFRGDRLSILGSDKVEKFKRYNLPYDQYFQYFKHIKGIDFNISLFNESPIDGIKTFHGKCGGKGNEMVFIPHTTSGLYKRLGYKGKELNNEVIKYYLGCDDPQNLRDIKDGIIKKNGKRVVDLVSNAGREVTKKTVQANSTDVDLITAMCMAREGFDSPTIDTVHIIGQVNSMVQMVQMIGRALRDQDQKNEIIRVNLILPRSSTIHLQNKDQFMEEANGYLKGVIMSMMLENILSPPDLTIRERRERSDENTERGIDDIDESTQAAIYQDIGQGLLKHEYNPSLVEDVVREAVLSNINDVSKDEMERLVNDFTRRTRRNWFRRIALMDGLDINNIDMTVINDEALYNGVHRLFGVALGKEAFNEFREMLSKDTWDFETVKQNALLFQNKTEWTRQYPGARRAADRLGITDCVTSHMDSTYTIHDLRSCLSQCSSYTEFGDRFPSQREWARRNGILKQETQYLNYARIVGGWTDQEALETAKQFQMKSHFEKSKPGAFNYLKKRGLLNDACSHMKQKQVLTYEEHLDKVCHAASKCESKKKFRERYRNEYDWAYRHKILDEICINMLGKIHWNHETVKTEAQKYKNTTVFRKKAGGAYNYAKRNNILNEVCDHMKKGKKHD